jgi:hypothetical protein
MNRKKWLLSALIAMSLISATLDGLFYWLNVGETSTTVSLSYYLYVILLVLWLDTDSKDHLQITKSFDYGFLVYLFWLPYLPYYLWRTRGPLGLLMFAGFLILLLLGWLIQIGIYMVRVA